MVFIIISFTDIGSLSYIFGSHVTFNEETRVLGRVASCGRTQFEEERDRLNISKVLFNLNFDH